MSDEIQINLNEDFLKNLHKLPIVTSKVEAAAKLIAEEARKTAPVESGEYKASIKAEPSKKSESPAWVVIADDPGGWIEFGNTNTPGHFTLRNAVQALGFKLRGRKK